MNKIDMAHEVMNGLDPELVEQAAQTTTKRLTRPVRTVLVAACLCVALLGAAMAAEELLKSAEVQRYFSGSQFSEVMQKLDRMYQIVPGREDNASGYVIPWEGSGVSLENISDDLRALIESCEQKREVESIRFDSAADMQEFMGLTLYENAALDRLERRALTENDTQVEYDDAGDPVCGSEVVGAVLRCTGYENGRSRLDLLHFCALNNGALEIIVQAEVVGFDLEDSNGTAFVFVDGTQFSQESYVTANGDSITIIRCDVPENGENAAYTQYSAHFHVGGVRYQLSIMCLENPEEGSALMKEILDGFQFHELK